MSLTLNLKQISILDKTSFPKSENINPGLKEIEDKCYENLMDVCRGLAASLEVNTSAIMSIEVRLKKIFKYDQFNILYYLTYFVL